MHPLSLLSVPLTAAQTEDCLHAVAKGDSQALGTLYRAAAPSVYAFAFSMLKNAQDAEDVLHDCFLQIEKHAASYERREKPMAWILTITKNLCLTRLRQQQKCATLSEDGWQTSLADEVTVEDRIVLRTLLTHLSDEERQIVVLHAVSGFKHREIAHLLSLPLSTVLSKYRRALKKLRSLL